MGFTTSARAGLVAAYRYEGLVSISSLMELIRYVGWKLRRGPGSLIRFPGHLTPEASRVHFQGSCLENYPHEPTVPF